MKVNEEKAAKEKFLQRVINACITLIVAGGLVAYVTGHTPMGALILVGLALWLSLESYRDLAKIEIKKEKEEVSLIKKEESGSGLEVEIEPLKKRGHLTIIK